MFREILFPVDFSENSQRIIPYVLGVARKFEAKVHIIYVARDLSHLGVLYVPDPKIATMATEIQQGAATMMQEFTGEHMAGLENKVTEILSGDPAEEIVSYVKENHIDMIIMGTHGRKGMDRVIFGSVAENVVRNSPVPVMTVNPHLVTAK